MADSMLEHIADVDEGFAMPEHLQYLHKQQEEHDAHQDAHQLVPENQVGNVYVVL